MSALENIRAAEESVAMLQHQLDEVQRVLSSAEEVAVVGEAAKRRMPLIVLGLVAVAGVVVAVRYVQRQRAQRSEAGSYA